jgi:hypothetical protein
MEDLVQIPLKEYEALKEKLALLQDSELVRKMTRLLEILYEEKHGLYLGDDTSDLSAASAQHALKQTNDAWDNV